MDVSIDVPRDMAIVEVLEVTDVAVKVVGDVVVMGRTLTIRGVPLDNATPARMFVLASNTGVRAWIAGKLKK